MEKRLWELAGILHDENCSCVIFSGGQITLCRDRGVKDLYRLLCETPEILDNALIADKVIGKGAAALMILGKVKEIYADVISQAALNLLKSAGIPLSYDMCVPNIINRARTGICPVESLCTDAMTAEECHTLISRFLKKAEK